MLVGYKSNSERIAYDENQVSSHLYTYALKKTVPSALISIIS